jgi:hypothetical protein
MMRFSAKKHLRRFISSSRASVTLQTIALLILVSAIGFGVVALILTAKTPIAQANRAAKNANELAAATTHVIEELKKNPTIEADSSFDPAYRLADYSGVTIEINELSSRLNPNWIRKGILTNTNLVNLLIPGVTADKLQQYREDNGLSNHLEGAYKDFFTEDAIKNYLGVYSYANINSSDEFTLRRLYFDVTQNKAGSEFFHNKISQQLREKKIMTENGLEMMLGVSGSEVRNVLTTEGQLNVNFVDPYILTCVLSYKSFNIGGYKSVSAAIVSARKSAEINGTRLRSLLGGLEATHPIFGYLGVRSWFWEIRATKGGRTVKTIVARALPLNTLEQEEKIRIIEVENP